MFKFIYPEFILLMLIPSFLLIYLVATNKSNLEKLFDQKLLKRLIVDSKSLSRNVRNALLFFALIFMIIALARPVLVGEKIEVKGALKSFLIAIDISNSMMARDIFPNRLKAAKEKAKKMILLNQEAEIGLIAFSSTSFLIAPLTQDTNTLLYFLENLDFTTISHAGTNFLSPIKNAAEILKDRDSKILILLTDGGHEKSFEKEIELAKQNNLKIYILNIGTYQGSPIFDKDGNLLKDENNKIVIVSLNDAIKELALQSNGGYIEYSPNNMDIQEISGAIKKGDNTNTTKEVVMLKELFYYPLGIAIILLLISFSSLPRKSAIMAIFIFLPIALKAGIFDFLDLKKAKESYQNNEFNESIKIYEKLLRNSNRNELHFNLANSYYKNKEYQKALNEYQKIQTEDPIFSSQVLHNIGNTQALLGNIDEAILSYEKALKLREDNDTRTNLELLKRLKEPQKNEQKEENKNQKDQSNTQEYQEPKSEEQNQSNHKDSINTQDNDNQMSQMELKKWLDELDRKTKPTFIYNMDKNTTQNIKNPW